MRCEMSERPLSGCLEDAPEEAETRRRPGVWERAWGENLLGKDEAWPVGVGGTEEGTERRKSGAGGTGGAETDGL